MTDASTRRGSFPIVAVGGSAGGLAATTELLRQLGDDPGLGLVVIHHLEPTSESGLVGVLSNATPLPVLAAADGVRVEIDHVYVIPPNTGLLIVNGILRLVPRVEERGIHLPINRFFESLALDRDGLAVGVVLSGSGMDGAEGVKLIKRESGITFAQDASAEYDSMPKGAIATGCVDYILPPAGIARELIRIGAQAPAMRDELPSVTDADYARILAAMRHASGVDFSSYKQTTVRRRLDRRLFLHGLTDLPAYLDLLKRDPTEIGALCEEALIHVTGFFRDPQAFEALRAQVFPKLCEGRAGSPIRIWVPGCSTGEEVYSIAICLLEYLEETGREVPIQMFGTDLSQSVIEKARAGRYRQSIESEISAERLKRFFSRDDAGYQVRRDLRDLCVFAKHDVARDPPFSSMDFISCRNLMIYMGPALQERVIGLFHYALNDSGFLLLGTTETVHAFAGFSAVDGKCKIYTRTAVAARRVFDFAMPMSLPDIVPPTVVRRHPGLSDVHREADRLVLAKFAPPGVVVAADLAVIQFRGHTGPYLEHAPGIASLELFRTVREELRLPLRRAIERARSTDTSTREAGVDVMIAGERHVVTLEVIPLVLRGAAQRYYLVLFEDVVPENKPARVEPDAEPAASAESALRGELASTRQYLESIIEQLEVTNEDLKAANEEVVSSNEELRSTNEELQSAKEELQATNEELRTVNDEMRDRSVEATRLSDDLANVLSSIEIPILIAGRDGRLRRFTPAAARAFGLLATDIGRPLQELTAVMSLASTLPELNGKVLQQLQPLSSAYQDALGHWYELWVRPYVALDGRVEGTVILARDLDAERKVSEYQERIRRMAFDAKLTEERERRRIAVELHDRLGQTLALAEIKLTSVRGELTGEVRAAVDGAVELLEKAIEDKRAVVFELSPPLLYDLGLKEALAWFAEDLEKRHGLKVEITDDGVDKPLSDAAKAVAYRIVRELVMNVLKHADVPMAKVSLRRVDDQLEIAVQDRGAGFELDAEPSRGGFGLLSAREQITGLGGAMKVESVRGLGTIANLRIPLAIQAPPDQGTPT